tara:strand:+ start:2182 stop:2871 length:690 start_codon:yes stop_codon:yes gene_type:complete
MVRKKLPDFSKKIQSLNSFFETWGPISLTLILYVGIRNFIVEARYIPSGSMLPGLKINDRLIVEKISLRQRSPRRGEIIVFNSPYSFDEDLIANRRVKLPSKFKCSLITFPLVSWLPFLSDSACDAYIKRVVAVGGDRLIVDRKGSTVLNGRFINEPYVQLFCSKKEGLNLCPSVNVTIPKGHVYVLGDNRANSWDSRFWPSGGFLPETEILGKAAWRFWPFNRLGKLE